jgi:hypothetical protein
MKANELRLGNLVNWNFEIAKISQILEVEVAFKCGDIGFISDLNPIPLTEGWLLNFGFEKKVFNSDIYDGVEYNLEINGFILNYYDDDNDFSLAIHLKKNDFGFCPDLSLFKNVHQLQNLYFALTGKELTIKNQE